MAVRRNRHDVGVLVDAARDGSSMLWAAGEDRRMMVSERQLLDAIAAGDLDEHLVAIAEAVRARRELLHTVDSAKVLAELCAGDTVMFNHRIKPRYLEHELAQVTQVGERSVTLRLWRPVGRFDEGELRCPPLALRKVDLPPGSAPPT